MLSKGNQRILNNLNHADYGLPTIEECIQKATREMPIYEGTPEDWFEKNQILTDYAGRKIVISRQSFTKHTTGEKYLGQNRPDMLNAISEILKKPDEVWIKDHSQNSHDVNFIKYYKGKAMNVICIIEDLTYSISTWFEIMVNNKTRHRYRRGLLIKK